MSEKIPQSTATLVKRLRRLAQVLSNDADDHYIGHEFAKRKARANTCWQAAGRLEELAAMLAGITSKSAVSGGSQDTETPFYLRTYRKDGRLRVSRRSGG